MGDKMLKYLAHIREKDFVEQSVQEHLEEVAKLAREYGEKVNLGAHAELAGFLHDMGKFTIHFTEYLKSAVIDKIIMNKKIDHSTAGAKYLYDNYYGKNRVQNYVIETVGMAILSHHSGMQNFIQPNLSQSDYLRRVTNVELPYYDEVVKNFESISGNTEKIEKLIEESKQEFEDFMKKIQKLNKPFTYLNLMQKLVFSCLIDADRTNTRCFEENEDYNKSNYESVFQKGYKKLKERIALWENDLTPINSLRNKMSNRSDVVGEMPSGIYKLSIPTGGGKTYASLRYALKHALKYNKHRIIYVVPYTTILEQNANAIREIIGQPEAVLEHHANVVDDSELDFEMDFYNIKNHKRLQLGRDNWDHPIIFTTMVQFLDVFFQKGTRKSRRLHNLANSIVVFDEVQSVPFQHTDLFSISVNFLHAIGNSSILLCTATQPSFDKMQVPMLLNKDAEIVPNLNEVIHAFKRVSFHNKIENESWDARKIANFVNEVMESSNSVLIILNTKTAVKRLYEKLSEQESVHIFHLSTSMCPAHRKEQLDDIRRKLGNEKVICISTQLIEAGVDISFETVIRSLAGLDSIAQAAGRCNRNGELDEGHVYIISPKDEQLSKLPEIRIGAEVTRNYILSNPKFSSNLLSVEAMETYFTYFRAQADREIRKIPRGLDYELLALLDGNFASKIQKKTLSIGMFKTIEKHFEAISSPTTSILVPYKEGKEIIANLNEDNIDYSMFNQLMKRAQQFSVNLFEHELQVLSNKNLITPLFNDSIYCLNERAYSETIGVELEGKADLENLLF